MGGRLDTEAVDSKGYQPLATAPDTQFDRGRQQASNPLHLDSAPAFWARAIDTGNGLHEGGDLQQFPSGV